MSCQRCSAPAQGRLCKQCEILEANEHLADELRDGESSDGTGGTRPVPPGVENPGDTEGETDE